MMKPIYYYTDGNGILSDKGVYEHTKLLNDIKIVIILILFLVNHLLNRFV